MEQPPDLDQDGKPIGSAPPDLDASGKPIAAPTAQPVMTRSRTGQMYDQAAANAPGVLWTAVQNHPAEAGAIAGGMAAVPLTGGTSLIPIMAAAGLGGAGGAGLGMIAGAAGGSPNLPTTAPGVLKKMGELGAIQAGTEGGGQLASRALNAGAGRVYQGLLKPTLAMRAEHPALVETALANRIPISAGGAEKAGELVGQSMGKADALVANTPGTINPRHAVAGITHAVQDVKDLPVARPQMKAIGDYARQYLAEHPGQIALPDAQRAVRATDKFFNPAYRATMDRGNAVTSGSTAAALGINNETRGLLRDAVPGLKEQNAVTSGLAGVRDAVERRAGQQGNLSPVGMQHLINAGIGGGVGAVGGREKGLSTFAAMEMLTNPAIGSRLAIGAHMAQGVPWAQAMRAAMLAKLAGDE